MTYAVVREASFCLVHTPGLMQVGSTTLAQERTRKPDGPLMHNLPRALRSYESAVAYPPNQVFIGNRSPDELAAIAKPWFNVQTPQKRTGPLGEIMPEPEFICLLAACDDFDVVALDQRFVNELMPVLAAHPVLGAAAQRLGPGHSATELAGRIERGALALMLPGWTDPVGVVGAGSETDHSLSAHIMLENLTGKASAWVAAAHLLVMSGFSPLEIDYVLECSEEACGDANQRGGGNFAKAVAEVCGMANATGADVRAFCAAPAHAMVSAAGLVQAGIFRRVLIVAGGSLAKLGMNARDHVSKGMPVLEDVLGAFAVLITADDGFSPRIRTDLIGTLPVRAGGSPQAVVEALVAEPLRRAGLQIGSIDRYASELHNSELTEPSGAGDIPRANARMIAALAVKQGEIGRSELDPFAAKLGVTGFAPTQGHVPSGIPYLGHALPALRSGQFQRVMIIGKGSLFLGRLTNLFDGVSVMLESARARPLDRPANATARQIHMALDLSELERGPTEVRKGLTLFGSSFPGVSVAVTEGDRAGVAEGLDNGKIHGALCAHYAFPIGVATVARLAAPGSGRPFLLATTTGAASDDRVAALVRNAVYGIAVAKCLGQADPTVAFLNLDGAAEALARFQTLRNNGYPARLASSLRAHGGHLVRGNDLVAGTGDVVVTDTLTGNLLVKLLTADPSGGAETQGEGYGVGVGPGAKGVVGILSRASTANVISAALALVTTLIERDLPTWVDRELIAAGLAGLYDLAPIHGVQAKISTTAPSNHPASNGPDPQPGTTGRRAYNLVAELPGVDVLRIDEGVAVLHQSGFTAIAGMGCLGPVILVSPEQREPAFQTLLRAGIVTEPN